MKISSKCVKLHHRGHIYTEPKIPDLENKCALICSWRVAKENKFATALTHLTPKILQN